MAALLISTMGAQRGRRQISHLAGAWVIHGLDAWLFSMSALRSRGAKL